MELFIPGKIHSFTPGKVSYLPWQAQAGLRLRFLQSMAKSMDFSPACRARVPLSCSIFRDTDAAFRTGNIPQS